jgi:hypothetical protein
VHPMQHAGRRAVTFRFVFARRIPDAFAQIALFTAPVSAVIVRRESRDLEWFCRKEHQSGNEY